MFGTGILAYSQALQSASILPGFQFKPQRFNYIQILRLITQIIDLSRKDYISQDLWHETMSCWNILRALYIGNDHVLNTCLYPEIIKLLLQISLFLCYILRYAQLIVAYVHILSIWEQFQSFVNDENDFLPKIWIYFGIAFATLKPIMNMTLN